LSKKDCFYRATDLEVAQLKWTKMTAMNQGMSLLGREIVPVFVPGERGCSPPRPKKAGAASDITVVSPATKEPSGFVRQDGKRPNGLMLIPWHSGKSLAWDVTVVSTLAQSYVDRAATGVGAVAEMAAERKLAKYSNLASNFIFQPIAVENLGAFSLSTLEFLNDFGHKLSSFSG